MSATLPTPPRSSTDKENWEPSSSSLPSSSPRKSIGWATTKEVFSYAPASGRVVTVPKETRGPRKSILKPSRPSTPCVDEKQRDETPLPENALENAQFLVYPVSMIVGKESTLRELTEAYSILTARIRQAVPQNFLSSPTYDARHALFDPLRQEADALSSAIIRDLGRVFADPFVPPNTPPASPSKTERHSLSTPQDSPAPKKGGMNEEQVKYARDLSTVANATVKFLTTAFQVPAIYNVFSHKQLSTMLTALLAIPLADSIRSPAARKICGLAITALQSQRLPDAILTSAAPRIAFALKRAIEGELGREGKKGATGEAFKAVHDLSTYRPRIFIPIFKIYLTTLLEALLMPSCPLRILAAHALGGFVLGITRAEEDFEEILRDISPIVSEFFLWKEPQPGSQTTILRTLRTTFRTIDPMNHAQGPFWASTVLASLIVLLGPALLKDTQVLTTFRGIIDIGLKAKKRIVRAITSTLWGPLIWVWLKWRGSMNDDDTEEAQENDDPAECEKVKKCFSSMIRMTTHLPIGVSFIGALLGSDHATCREDDLFMALHEIKGSARMGGESTQRALDLIDRLVNTREDSDFYDNWRDNFLGELVPKPLFSVSPGLLTTEMNLTTLSTAIEGIVGSQPSHVDVRPLADQEKCIPGVWTRIEEAWMSCIEQLELSVNEAVPDSLIDIWTGLVRMGLLGIKDASVPLMEYGSRCVEVLISIFANKTIDLRERPDDQACAGACTTAEGADMAANDGTTSAANMRLKLMLVRTFWTHTIDALPPMALVGAWKPMIRYLTRHQDTLVPSGDSEPSDDEAEALSEWSQFCGQVAALASADITQLLWAHPWDWDKKSRARAWRGYARGWADDSRGSWREAGGILGLPFKPGSSWDMEDADFSAWSSLLAYAAEVAGKERVPAPEVLEHVVSRIEDQDIIELTSTLRVADLLVGTFNIHIENCSGLPDALIHFVHEILLTAYPPKPSNKTEAIWLLRSLQASISNCPTDLLVNLIEKIHDGVCLWISDECSLFSAEEYSSEIIPLFQTVLCALESLPPSAQILQSFSAFFASALQTVPDTGELSPDRAEALTAFMDFWNNNCRLLEVPKGGWSDGIAQALALAFPTATANCAQPTEIDLPNDAPSKSLDFIPLLDSDEEEDELDVLPRTTTPRRRPSRDVPLPGSPELSGDIDFCDDPFVPPATTPKKSAKFVEVYDEPRLPGLFDKLSSRSLTRGEDALHNRRSQRTRRSRTVSGSSNSYFNGAEKENVSPKRSQAKPVNGTARLGLKRSSDTAAAETGDVDVESSPLSAKRLRTETCGSDDSDDMRNVEMALRVVGRSPFGVVNTNANANLQTPTKPVRTQRTSRSAGKREKTRPSVIVLNEEYDDSDDNDDDDDEYLPSSSDIESEEENSPSSSSSPVGPFTPRTTRRAEYAIAIKQGSDLASDDIVTSSSPTRRIRRMARGERMRGGVVKKSSTVNDTSGLKWARSVRT